MCGLSDAEVDSAGEESDGGSELDRLPDDSSSDDDVGGPSISKVQAGPTVMLARTQAVAPNQYMPLADPRMLPHAHASMPAGNATHAGLTHPRAGAHGGMPAGGTGVVAPASKMPHSVLIDNGVATAGHSHLKSSAAAGAEQPTSTPSQRAAVASEDPTVRRIKAQVTRLSLPPCTPIPPLR